ncbi:5-methyltetrahydropteroyltriglutamate--homocysteine methyltransferase [Halolamina sediminis]|uniref:5-methyltetrahydropteroyltriglutamate-- homocysteine methyltransferase n=1 Tax=Halolamina sediminis TaxID=1480675 RepID=UPI0006B5F295|nr:5-methyltetrahydropteroyltriglutamate--homocysteine methyltransferase [Halolamina sediminis]
MTERVATTLGLHPLPDWAKDELSDLKGHQKGDLVDGDEEPEVRAAYERVREVLIEDQRAAGLDRLVEGQGRWDDFLAHPLAVHESVETGGIVRYYDNNNFYRDPRVVDDLAASGDVPAELDAAMGLLNDDESLQTVLPGPYTLAELATDEHYGDEAEFLAAIAAFLAGEVEALPAHETLFLLDPSLVTDPPEDDENERVSDAVDTVANATDADVVLQSYWGAHEEKTYAHLMDADVDALGFDFVAGDRDAHLYNVTEFGTKDDISLGLVDGQNTAVESADTVAERIDWVQEQIPSQTFDTVYATPNTELAYLPVSTYREKLSVLAEAAEIAPETEVSA